MQTPTLKANQSFIRISTKDKINIVKVDLKGVHIEGHKTPVLLFQAITLVKNRMWIPA